MIEIGMTEAEMLDIMGTGYTISKLKNNRTKYEWRIKASSYGQNGFRTYSGVQKATIYCKDGIVEEIKGLILDRTKTVLVRGSAANSVNLTFPRF